MEENKKGLSLVEVRKRETIRNIESYEEDILKEKAVLVGCAITAGAGLIGIWCLAPDIIHQIMSDQTITFKSKLLLDLKSAGVLGSGLLTWGSGVFAKETYGELKRSSGYLEEEKQELEDLETKTDEDLAKEAIEKTKKAFGLR